MNIGGNSHPQNCRFDLGHGVAQSDSLSQIERDRDRGKLALVIDGEGGILRLVVCEGAEGHLVPFRRFHVQAADPVGAVSEGRIDLHHDVILV